jgi:4-amino-4-deoxy-L-arabinose transferase-like glycosyltransferase
MGRERSLSVAPQAALLFGAVAALLLWFHGNRLVFSNDEGIILDAASRMLHGQVLYRDFFGYMSPGSYWLQEAVFRLFGVSQLSGRLIVILDFSLECALVFWMTARLAGRKTGFVMAALFFVLQTAPPEFLTAQHRMDSTALSLASIALALEGQRRGHWGWWFAGGIVVSAAALCTPSVALLAPVTLAWLVFTRPLRRFVLPYTAGAAAGALAILAALWATGLLLPTIRQMAWLSRNYSAVNYMPYGSLIGGYGQALGQGPAVQLAIRAALLLCVALPAVLPVVALAGWTAALARRRAERKWAAEQAIPYLLAAMAVYIAIEYPRADVMHLAFVAPLPYVLAGALAGRYLPRPLTLGLVLFFGVGAAVFAAHTAGDLLAQVPVRTPAGSLRASPEDAAALRTLLAVVERGEGLYVHPYMPLLYFLTQTANPTRFSYLAPGMMTRQEELTALDELRANPPPWILYLPVSRAEFLRIFPNAGQLDHRFPALEAWIEQEYKPLSPPLSLATYQLYSRK